MKQVFYQQGLLLATIYKDDAMKYLLCFLLGMIGFTNLYATTSEDLSGLWKTYDLTDKPRSILRFYPTGDTYQADVIKILDPRDDACAKCPGDKKDKPYIGMTIIEGLKFRNNEWQDGIVLDTDTGKTYRCKITLSEDGKQMYFRAYMKLPLLGRTVHWKRVD
jgi:hypothetical protein